jgi:hypothetical protein
MNEVSAEQAAFTLMATARGGEDISARYNSLNIDEQRQVFSQMKNLQQDSQTMHLFGNIELIDINNDGRMDDARVALKGGGERDVYNTGNDQIDRAPKDAGTNKVEVARNAENHAAPGGQAPGKGTPAESGEEPQFRQLSRQEIARDPYLRQADGLLRQASRGQDIYGALNQSGNDPRMMEAMRAVQANKPEYANVKLVDANGDGVIDDVRTLVGTRNGPQEVDTYKTAGDAQTERLKQQGEDALRRGGDIVIGEVFNSMRRGGRGPDFGDRVGQRMGREGIQGAQRVLRDVIRGR